MRDHSSPNSLFFNCYVKDFLCTSELGKAGENKKTSHLISEGSSSCSANAFSPFFSWCWLEFHILSCTSRTFASPLIVIAAQSQREMGESWNNNEGKRKNWITKKKFQAVKASWEWLFKAIATIYYFTVLVVSLAAFFRIYFFSFFLFKLFFFPPIIVVYVRMFAQLFVLFEVSENRTYGHVADPSHSELTCWQCKTNSRQPRWSRSWVELKETFTSSENLSMIVTTLCFFKGALFPFISLSSCFSLCFILVFPQQSSSRSEWTPHTRRAAPRSSIARETRSKNKSRNSLTAECLVSLNCRHDELTLPSFFFLPPFVDISAAAQFSRLIFAYPQPSITMIFFLAGSERRPTTLLLAAWWKWIKKYNV